MPDLDTIENQIFRIKTQQEFNELALKIFHFQYENNRLYHDFVNYLNVNVARINHFLDIPFLPIELFKNHKVISQNSLPKLFFSSSGTTGMQTSTHYVAKEDLYVDSFSKGFQLFFGDPKDLVILAMLPSYLEQKNSSLVYMAKSLIEQSGHVESGFYLNNYKELSEVLSKLKSGTHKVMLLGVTYALLDLAEQYPIHFPELQIVETGGMKGRRKEMIRDDLHNTLNKAFGTTQIHSEYGMTELLSQAWSLGDGIFKTPPWMKVLIRDINDPFCQLKKDRTGGINVIDLANLYSCSFIATQDLGKKLSDKFDTEFTVLGRFDNSDIRGCNLLVE